MYWKKGWSWWQAFSWWADNAHQLLQTRPCSWVHSHPPTGPATGGLSYLITTVCSVRFSCHKVHKAPRTNHLLSNDNSVKWSSLSEQPQMGCWGEQFISGKFALMAVKVTNYQLLHHRKTPATARRWKSYFKQCYRFSGNHKLTTSHCLSVDFQ